MDEYNDLIFSVFHQNPQGQALFQNLYDDYVVNPKLCRDKNGSFDVNATLIAAAQQEVIMKFYLVIQQKIKEAENARRNKQSNPAN